MIIRENVPKQETVKESSFLDKVTFEESSLLEGKFMDALFYKRPSKKELEDQARANQKTRENIEKSMKELNKPIKVPKRKNFSKEEASEVVKNFDKACKAMNRWLLTLKPKIKLDAFNIDDGFTYEYDDTDSSYTLTQYISDTKRRYDEDDNDLSDVQWCYGTDWQWPENAHTEEYRKQIKEAKDKITDEFKKFIKSNGFKEESYAGDRMIVGYGSSKYPDICMSYNIKDDEFSVFVDCTGESSK